MKRTSRPAKRTSRRPKRGTRRAIRNPKLVGNEARPDEPLFVDTISSIETLLSKPGAYYTTTGQQAYGVAKALEWHPLIKPGEETFFVEGSVYHFEVLPEPPNMAANPPTVGWGTTRDYYERRIESYDKWELAWWREVAQNSRDARATRFDWTCEPGVFTDPDTKETTPAMMVVARDDGTGMDEATLRAAFFTRGGSVKEAGAVGGFGDAKELILTPWLGYEVRTRDLIARGRHEELFAPGVEGGQKFIQGTEVKVWMPMSRTTTADFAMSILERSSLPGITTTVNGKRISANLSGGTKVHTGSVKLNDGSVVGSIEIYHQPRSPRSGVYVRGNGVFMFESRGEIEGKRGFKGVVYVDIKAPPRSVFTKKRDALSWESSARNTVEHFVTKLATDPMTVLRAERAQELVSKTIVKGTGPISVREGIAAEVAAKTLEQFDVTEMQPKKAGKSFSIQDGVLEAAVQAVERAQAEGVYAQESGAPKTEIDLTPHITAVRAVLGGVEMFKVEHVAGAIRMAAWKPDFMIDQQLPGYRMPKKLDPATMQPKYLRLIRLWSELCKYALIQVGLFKPFGVGWVFDSETDKDGQEMVTGGEYIRHNGMHWLLLNPLKLKVLKYEEDQGEYKYEEVEDHHDLGSDADLQDLCATAIHEVTHMQGYDDHDQAFSYALTDNIKIAFGMMTAAKKILKAVNVQTREEGAARKAAQAEKVSVPWDVTVGRVAYALQAWDGFTWSGMRKIEAGGVTPEEVADDVQRYYTSPESVMIDFRGHPPKRAEFVLKPKTVLKLHDALLAKGALRDVKDDDARTFASLAWASIPPDPREKIAAPTNIGVYTWVKGPKADESYEYVLRVGYAGQRGAEVVRTEIGSSRGSYSVRSTLEDMAPGAIGEYERENNIHRRYQDNLIWVPFGATEIYLTPADWRVKQAETAEYEAAGRSGPLDVRIDKDKDGVRVYSTGGGPPRKTFSAVAEAQKYVVEWAITNRVQS